MPRALTCPVLATLSAPLFLLLPALLLPPAAVAAKGTGGIGAPRPPLLREAGCISTEEVTCPAGGALVRGASVALAGADLQATKAVVFLGRRGRADDVAAKPRLVRPDRIDVVVPERARSGRLAVVNALGARATIAKRLQVTSPPPPEPVDTARGTSFFYLGKRKPSFSFQVSSAQQAQVELVQEADGSVVRSWDVPAQPGQTNSVEWDGLAGDGRPLVGRYRFRLKGQAVAAAASAGEGAAFSYYDHLFPIRGPHDLGQTPANAFGGARGHKGQDMFAACGTPVAAARAGKVKYAGYHSAAGNYAVIDGEGTDVDYAYLHMLKPALVRTGERVFTGQALGAVGDTGRATGCHLHFEIWSAPGWYDGGSALDPLPSLRAWASYSGRLRKLAPGVTRRARDRAAHEAGEARPSAHPTRISGVPRSR